MTDGTLKKSLYIIIYHEFYIAHTHLIVSNVKDYWDRSDLYKCLTVKFLSIILYLRAESVFSVLDLIINF